MVWSSPASKWPIPVPFCGIIKNPIFHYYLTLFLPDAVEPSRCQFFENWLLKHKCPNLLKPLGTIIQQNYWSFYPSEPFSFVHFNMIHPVFVTFDSTLPAWIFSLFAGKEIVSSYLVPNASLIFLIQVANPFLSLICGNSKDKSNPSKPQFSKKVRTLRGNS